MRKKIIIFLAIILICIPLFHVGYPSYLNWRVNTVPISERWFLYVKQVGRAGGRQSLRPLDRSWVLKNKIVCAGFLLDSGADNLLDGLKAQLNGGEGSIAAWALGELGHEATGAVPDLIEYCKKTRDWDAITALGAIQDDRAIPILMDMLLPPEDLLTLDRAKHALQKFPALPDFALETLNKHLRHTNKRLRDAARDILKNLKKYDENLLFPVDTPKMHSVRCETVAEILLDNQPWCLAADGERLFVGNGARVTVLNIRTREILSNIPLAAKSSACQIAVANNRLFVDQAFVGQLSVFDLQTLEKIEDIAISGNGSPLVVSSNGKFACLPNNERSEFYVIDTHALKHETYPFFNQSKGCLGACLSKDGNQFYAAKQVPPTIEVLNPASGQKWRDLLLDEYVTRISWLIFSHDESELLSGMESILILDAKTLQPKRRFVFGEKTFPTQPQRWRNSWVFIANRSDLICTTDNFNAWLESKLPVIPINNPQLLIVGDEAVLGYTTLAGNKGGIYIIDLGAFLRLRD
jgi:hypothetical protein